MLRRPGYLLGQPPPVVLIDRAFGVHEQILAGLRPSVKSAVVERAKPSSLVTRASHTLVVPSVHTSSRLCVCHAEQCLRSATLVRGPYPGQVNTRRMQYQSLTAEQYAALAGTGDAPLFGQR